METELDGHVAVVTGGGRGIGRGIVQTLADEGAHVVIWDRDDAAHDFAAELNADGAAASGVVADVADRAAVDDAVASIAADRERIDILVNCAGFTRDAAVHEMTDDEWHAVLGVCLHGPFYLTRAVVPHMRSRQYGRIINISSRARYGEYLKVNYCAAKAGVDGLTFGLALELGSEGITANAIAPGYVETERLLASPYAAQIKERALTRTPGARLGTPADIADAVAYLASPRSGFINGEVITIAGGRKR